MQKTNRQTSVVIMAAGKGSRMHSSTPKVVHEICGKPMLFYIIQEALKLSDDIHVVLHHQAERIREMIEGAFDARITFHLQDVEHFAGTGGALMDRGEKRPFGMAYERVLILNGDMPLVRESDMQKILQEQGDIALCMLELENPSGYGRVEMQGAQVKSIIEDKDCDGVQKGIRLVNAGVYALDTKILDTFLPALTNHNAQGEYYLTDIVDFGVRNALVVRGVLGDMHSFMGVNSKLDLARAQDIMLERLRTKAMLQGVIMHLPHTIYIEEGVEFEGECELQEGVRITGASKIVRSIIKSHSIVESSQITDSDIGPLAHIRPKSVINKTHIGNFVEVKAGHLDGVKAGHLSYLGDCEIGEGSNVGAGVITCNYDGMAKHKTRIGKNVFIGSDSQLVAPLDIASDVLIGAGSTITKDCVRGDLALSRTEQRNIAKGFFRFFKRGE